MLHHLPAKSSEESSDHQGARGDMALLVGHLGAAYNLARWLMRDENEAEEASGESQTTEAQTPVGAQPNLFA